MTPALESRHPQGPAAPTTASLTITSRLVPVLSTETGGIGAPGVPQTPPLERRGDTGSATTQPHSTMVMTVLACPMRMATSQLMEAGLIGRNGAPQTPSQAMQDEQGPALTLQPRIMEFPVLERIHKLKLGQLMETGATGTYGVFAMRVNEQGAGSVTRHLH